MLLDVVGENGGSISAGEVREKRVCLRELETGVGDEIRALDGDAAATGKAYNAWRCLSASCCNCNCKEGEATNRSI